MALSPIPLANQSYELGSRPAVATRLLDVYAEKLPTTSKIAGALDSLSQSSRAEWILKPSPGTKLFRTIGTGPILAMASIPALLYVVSGNHFYRVHDNGLLPTEDLGDIAIADVPTIAIGPDSVIVVSPPNAYIALHDGPLSMITVGTGNFPTDGASSVAWIDGYFVFTSYTGDFFFCSSLVSGAVFDSLDYAKSERTPDYVNLVKAHNGELWFFGRDGSSVWYDAGQLDFPFRERAGSINRQGIGSVRTLAEIAGSLFWLGDDSIIYRTNGYVPIRISNHAIEEVLSRHFDLRDITACAFAWEGHNFYAVNMPNTPEGGNTFVYDTATGLWHERCSASDGIGLWTVNCASKFGPHVVLGDSVFGNLYEQSADVGTFNNALIHRIATLPILAGHGPRNFMSRLEIEMEVGSAGAPGPPTGPAVFLDWSDDGGITWTNPRTLSVGAIGATRTRVFTTRLGSFRNRILRIQADGRFTLYGVDVDISPGAS